MPGGDREKKSEGIREKSLEESWKEFLKSRAKFLGKAQEELLEGAWKEFLETIFREISKGIPGGMKGIRGAISEDDF